MTDTEKNIQVKFAEGPTECFENIQQAYQFIWTMGAQILDERDRSFKVLSATSPESVSIKVEHEGTGPFDVVKPRKERKQEIGPGALRSLLHTFPMQVVHVTAYIQGDYHSLTTAYVTLVREYADYCKNDPGMQELGKILGALGAEGEMVDGTIIKPKKQDG